LTLKFTLLQTYLTSTCNGIVKGNNTHRKCPIQS